MKEIVIFLPADRHLNQLLTSMLFIFHSLQKFKPQFRIMVILMRMCFAYNEVIVNWYLLFSVTAAAAIRYLLPTCTAKSILYI